MNGLGVQKDYNKAKNLFIQASKQGFKKAVIWVKKNTEKKNPMTPYELNFTGWKYYTGEGVPQNYTKAIEFFSAAAEHGYEKAKLNLGIIYHKKNNFREALYWYSKAAQHGLPQAQYNIGVLYFTQNNYTKAAEHFQKAAEQNYAKAEEALNIVYKKISAAQNKATQSTNNTQNNNTHNTRHKDTYPSHTQKRSLLSILNSTISSLLGKKI